MNQTLEQQSNAHNNDYTALEAIYHRITGGELVRDPISIKSESPQMQSESCAIVVRRDVSSLAPWSESTLGTNVYNANNTNQ